MYVDIYLKIFGCIVLTPPPPFLKGGSKFWLPPLEGENMKNKKGWEYGAGAGLLKQGEGSGTFLILFFQGLSFLPLEITFPFAKLCYAFEEKKFFSVTIVLW